MVVAAAAGSPARLYIREEDIAGDMGFWVEPESHEVNGVEWVGVKIPEPEEKNCWVHPSWVPSLRVGWYGPNNGSGERVGE